MLAPPSERIRLWPGAGDRSNNNTSVRHNRAVGETAIGEACDRSNNKPPAHSFCLYITKTGPPYKAWRSLLAPPELFMPLYPSKDPAGCCSIRRHCIMDAATTVTTIFHSSQHNRVTTISLNCYYRNSQKRTTSKPTNQPAKRNYSDSYKWHRIVYNIVFVGKHLLMASPL